MQELVGHELDLLLGTSCCFVIKATLTLSIDSQLLKKKNSGEQAKDNQHLQHSTLRKLCPKEVMPEYIQDLLFRDWICNGEKIVLGQHHFEL